MKSYNKNLKDVLKEKGLKLTPQRRSVLDVIYENKGNHLSTEEIYEMVKKKCPEIGLATVYRSMQLFDQANIVYKHNFNDGRSRYEIILDEDHQHHHLICTKCGIVIEVEEDLLEYIEHEIENKYNFTIMNHNVKFYGHCNKCSTQKK